MQPVTKTIKAQCETDWSLTARDQKLTDIHWRRGEPSDLNKRFSGKDVSLEFCPNSIQSVKTNLAFTKYNELMFINVWVRLKNRDDYATNDDLRQTIIQEIRRIVKLRQKTMTDIKLAWIQSERTSDDYESDAPALHTILGVACRYET